MERNSSALEAERKEMLPVHFQRFTTKKLTRYTVNGRHAVNRLVSTIGAFPELVNAPHCLLDHCPHCQMEVRCLPSSED
jgi:hypothetical protein